MCALLTLPSPYSRRYRDDLTVEVIFFGDAEQDANNTAAGKVSVNEDATASIRDAAKAKL
jgi:pyruvate dehydrogenase phosphatase